MTILFLVFAIISTIALVVSASNAIADATPTDLSSRGRWGVLRRGPGRGRRLDAHERRWQTALTSARNQPNRWPDLITEIRHLERTAELEPDPLPPEDYDAGWVEARLEALEHHLDINEKRT